MNVVKEGVVTPAAPSAPPKHARDDFESIVSPLAQAGLPTPCEIQVEELCGLAPRLAHFIISFVDCACPDNQTKAVCEPCMKEMLEWDFAWCPACTTVWSPAGDAIADVVRIRS